MRHRLNKTSEEKKQQSIGSTMLFNLVLVLLYNYFDLSVTDKSYVDEMRV